MATSENVLLPSQIGLLDQILAVSTDRIYVFDRNGCFLYASPAGLAAFGLEAADVLGQTWGELNLPLDGLECQEILRESVFQTGLPVRGEARLPTLEGRRDYHYVLSPLWGRDGVIEAVVSTWHDITEPTQADQSQVEQALQKSEANFKQAQEIAHLGIWEHNWLTQQVYWSEETYRIHGMPSGQPVLWGEDAIRYIYPDDHAKYRQEVLATVERGETFITDLRIVRADGAVRFIEARGEPLFDAHNTPIGLWGTIQDITDRKQAELALQESEARFAAAFHSSPDAILITRLRDGLILDVNPQFTEISGYSRAEVIGQTSVGLELWADAGERAAVVARLQTEPTIQNHEFSFRRQSGEILFGLFSCQVIELDGEACALSVVRDITQRKQAELALRESETRFLELSEASPVNIYILVSRSDRSFYFEHISRAIETIHEIPAEQFLENPYLILDSMHPDDRATYQAKVEQSLANLAPFAHEWRIVTPSGTIKWVQGASCPKQRANGEIAWYGAVIDITDRKQAEAKLQEGEMILHLFAQYAPAGLVMFDREMRYVMASQRWVDNHGLGSIDSIIGRSHYDTFTFPNLPEHLRQVHQRCLAGAVVTSDGDLFVLADGLPHWLAWEMHPWHTNTGEIGGVILSSIDITQLKQAELALQDLNQSLEQKVLERTAELHARELQIRQQANREALLREITQRIRQSLDLQTIFHTACEEILQWSQADRVGIFRFNPESHFDDGMFVAEAVISGFPSVLATPVQDHCFGNDYAPLYQQGRVQAIADIYNAGLQDCHRDVLAQFHIRANLIVPLLQGNDLWGLLCIHQCSAPRQWQPFEIQVAQEIANQLAIAIQQARLFEQLQQELKERQQAQQQLADRNQQLALSNQELARATQMKDEFLANMSHELRTPLNAILGMSEALQEQVFGEINEQQLQALQTIEHTGLHLLELINDILDLAKVESGQMELNCKPTNVMVLCQSSLEFIKPQARKKRIQCDLNVPPDLPDILVDERRIRQVLINLLNNAVKFTPTEGQIRLEVRWPSLSPVEEETTIWLQLAVLDTGIGIASDDFPALFQPFVQIDSALNRQYEGTGLGLSLVQRIVDLHGGQVGVTSELGVGSCFTIDLPTVIPQSSAPDPASQMVRFDPSQLGLPSSPLMLVVEDNEDNILTLVSYLEAKGYRLLVARNGQEAIALTQSEHPDLILMDIQMPGMDGLEAIRQIRCLPAQGRVPIIALTALAMEGDRDRCLAAGADDYLSKPIKLKQLVATIQQFLQPTTN